MKLLTITKNKKRLVNFKDYREERKSAHMTKLGELTAVKWLALLSFCV